MKKLLSSVVLVGLVALGACSGNSPSPKPAPTPAADTWTISLVLSSGEAFLNEVISAVATASKNGSAAPDGTTVTFEATGGVFNSGSATASVASSGGKATAYFSATEIGTYVIRARVAGVSVSASVLYKTPPPPATPDDLLIVDVAPDQGTLNGGDQVVLLGQGFVPPVDVFFNVEGIDYQAQVFSVAVDYSSATVITPEITGVTDTTREYSSNIRVVRNVGGQYEQSRTVPGGYAFLPTSGEPEIYQVFPDHGSARGGEQVTILGRNFTAPIQVNFGTVSGTLPGEFQQLSPDGRQITVLTPQVSADPLQADDLASVSVVNEANTPREKTITKPNAFTFVADQLRPRISAVSPSSGPIEGGTRITIFGEQTPGSGFQMPVRVVFTGSDIGTREADIVSVNLHEIVCLSPNVTDAQLTPPSTVDIAVTNVDSGLTETEAGAFTYGEVLFVSGNTPSEGPNIGGNLVTIFGSGFRDPLIVDWLGISPNQRVDVVAVSGSEIVVRMPGLFPPPCGDLTGQFKITHTESNISVTGGSYTYLGNTPVVLSVDPAFVSPPDANTVDIDTLTIHGQNFHAPVRVSINGLVLTEATASMTLTVVDEETIELTGIADVIGPNLIGLTYDTITCVDPNTQAQGVRDVATSVDVAVTNVAGNCTDTLADGLTYEPYDPSCRVAAVMEVRDNDAPGNPVLIDGASAEPFATTAHNNCSATHSFSIANVGGATMTGISVGMSGPFNVVQAPAPQLNPGDPASFFTVEFCPTVDDDGTQFGTMTVSSNASNAPIQVTLQGDEAATAITLSPGALAFPDTAADGGGASCSSLSFTVANTGADDLNWSAAITGADPSQFALTGVSNGTIAPGDPAVTVDVDFCPTTAGAKAAQVDVTSNDPVNPALAVTLTGTGI